MICKLLLLFVAAVTAHPCDHIGYNSTPQQDYAAIVLHGCDPFQVLRNRRLGSPRVQQDLIPDFGDGIYDEDMFALNALAGGSLFGGLMGGAATTSPTVTDAGSSGSSTTTSSTGGLDMTTMMLLNGDSEDYLAAQLMSGGGANLDSLAGMAALSGDSEDYITASMLQGGGLGAGLAGLGGLSGLALADEMSLRSPHVNAMRRKQLTEAKEEMNLQKVIHALTSGPTVTQEQLFTAAQLKQELTTRKASHQLRRPRVEQSASAQQTEQDLIPDFGDMGEFMIYQMMMGGGQTANTGTAAGSSGANNIVSSLLGGGSAGGAGNAYAQLAAADALSDILDSRRLRSPRATANANAASTAQLDDEIAMMMMMQNQGNPNLGTMMGQMAMTDIDDMAEAMAFAQMAGGSSTATTTDGGDGTSGTTTPASSSSNMMTQMMMMDADMDEAAAAMMMSGAMGGSNTDMATAVLMADGLGRRLRKPRQTSRLLPVYRKIQ